MPGDTSTELRNSSQLCVTIECGVVNQIGRCSPISIERVSMWCLFFHPHLTTHQLNIGDW